MNCQGFSFTRNQSLQDCFFCCWIIVPSNVNICGMILHQKLQKSFYINIKFKGFSILVNNFLRRLKKIDQPETIYWKIWRCKERICCNINAYVFRRYKCIGIHDQEALLFYEFRFPRAELSWSLPYIKSIEVRHHCLSSKRYSDHLAEVFGRKATFPPPKMGEVLNKRFWHHLQKFDKKRLLVKLFLQL